jgi:hypothetical protein
MTGRADCCARREAEESRQVGAPTGASRAVNAPDPEAAEIEATFRAQ